ncbi:ATP-dependent RNA helicase, putative [Plasmodium gallinaceum]|uniref:ATP-dependent RNA helicase n=1 Tax=Plasmodium gallinaceum TaxID=5849 RepID=A0A1J1GQG8_PLAGA|nr:ATP-dependent RNA helicase, putative [Plasmodium gallinaceum]CRG93290.1 ATP-dependent RNA helicase, putative [Plasmodium gallinaceum]
MYFHFLFFLFCFFLFFFKFFTTNSLIINSKLSSIAFLKTNLSKSYYVNLTDKKKIHLKGKKIYDEHFEKGKLKKKNEYDKTEEKKNQNEIKSKKNSNKSFKKKYYSKSFKRIYNKVEKDKELNTTEDKNEEKKVKRKMTKKKKYINRKKLKKKKKKIKKEEKILNMFQNNLNYSIEKLNKRTKKYEIYKENENLKNNVLKNEILQKVLGKNRPKNVKLPTPPKKKIFIDDISDNDDLNEKKKKKLTNISKKNSYEKFRFENNKNDNNINKKKEEKKKIKSKNYSNFKNLNHTNKINLEKKNKDLEQDRNFLKNDYPLVNKGKKENNLKTNITNNNKKEIKLDRINIHLKKNENIEKMGNEEKRKINEEKVSHNLINKNESEKIKEDKINNEKKNGKINKEKLGDENKDAKISTEEKINDEKNKSNIDIQNILKIGDSIDNFRREITISDNQNKEYNNIKSKLIKFDSIIDLNANKFAEKKKTTSNNENFYFKDVGIFDNFINVYLKYNEIKTTTKYQKRYIPLILFFINNIYYDLQNCLGYLKYKKLSAMKNTNFFCNKNSDSNFLQIRNKDNYIIKNEEIVYENIKKEKEIKEEDKKDVIEDKVKDNNITNDINYDNKIEQIIYVNKYNDLSKKLIRTFFLHCPTGTGKTLIYLLPIFQCISNFNFLEYEMLNLIKNDKYVKNILFDQKKIFYENKNINENFTSFFCIDKLKENFFIDYNMQKINNILDYLINKKKKKKKVINEDDSLKNEIKNDNHKEHIWNDNNINDLKIKKKNDILILTYNKELAVQIYELHKDIINSFYKSFNSDFFKNNDSLIFSNSLEEEEKSLIEKINVNFKKKININVYLLIGGNNIKYQLKSLKKKKINIINENLDSTDNCNSDNNINKCSDGNSNNCDNNNKSSDKLQNINIYIGTPGRLDKLINEKKIIKLKNISTVIFDEYDFFFNSFKTSDSKSSDQKIKLENPYFSKLLKSIYLNNKEENKIYNKKKISYTNVICCSATSAVYSYLTYTKHIITTNFLQNLRYKINKNILENDNLQNNLIINEKVNEEINTKNKNELINENKDIEKKNEDLKKYISFGNYELEKNTLNELFKINDVVKIPENLIHLNYYYDTKDKKKKNNAIFNFLKILFSNPLNKNVLVFCNTKKRVMDLKSLFRNRFDVDIQTIFGHKENEKEKKRKKKIFKDINYANFFKNNLIDYKNLKKYVNFLFISTNILYRGINCVGFTTVVNFDMPSNLTEYAHRCGRIGRINNKGTIINIFEKKYKRKYYKEIFNKLNINVFDIDCYMNNIFTLKKK